MSNVYVNNHPYVPAQQAPKRTKRAAALDILLANAALLETEGHKVYRGTCIDAIKAEFPKTTDASLGAIFNDAKHILIGAGEMKPFGRFGKGRNRHSAPKAEQPEKYVVPADHKWLIINKETREVEGSATSKNKAAKLKTAEQTVKKAA